MNKEVPGRFNSKELNALREAFEIDPYLSPVSTAAFAEGLNTTEKKIKQWFANERRRKKRLFNSSHGED